MIRALGCLLLASSTLALGVCGARSVRRTGQCLRALESALSDMTALVEFQLLPLPELLSRAGGCAYAPLGAVFRAAARALAADPSCTAHAALLGADGFSELPEPARAVLDALSRLLGQTDLEGQLAALRLAQRQTADALALFDRDAAGRARSRMALGIGAAAVLTILLI